MDLTFKMILKEYTKQLESEKLKIETEILKLIKDFEDFTGLSIEEVKTLKIYGENRKSKVIEVKIKAEV